MPGGGMLPANVPYFNVRDRMDMHEPHEPAVTPEQLQAYHTSLYGSMLGMQVWGVDGFQIRGSKDLDFTAGGNPARYRYVPNNELWVESALSPADALGVAVHEGIETVLMMQGASYETAHELSNVFEWNLRREMIDGKLAKPSTHDQAVSMADDWLRSKLEMVKRGVGLRRMTFPKNEVEALRSRLQTKGFAFTTRVDAEQGKWRRDEVVESPLGKLRIVDVKTLGSLAKHPFLNELTPEQASMLVKHGKMDVIKFAPAS